MKEKREIRLERERTGRETNVKELVVSKDINVPGILGLPKTVVVP